MGDKKVNALNNLKQIDFSPISFLLSCFGVICLLPEVMESCCCNAEGKGREERSFYSKQLTALFSCSQQDRA